SPRRDTITRTITRLERWMRGSSSARCGRSRTRDRSTCRNPQKNIPEHKAARRQVHEQIGWLGDFSPESFRVNSPRALWRITRSSPSTTIGGTRRGPCLTHLGPVYGDAVDGSGVGEGTRAIHSQVQKLPAASKAMLPSQSQ